MESCWNWVLRRETDVFHYTELIWIINLVFSFNKMIFHWDKCSHVCSPLSPSRELGCSGPWPTRQSIFLTKVSSRTPPAVLWRLTMRKYLPFPYSSFAYNRTIHFDFEICVYILVIRSFTTFSPRLKSSSMPYISMSQRCIYIVVISALDKPFTQDSQAKLHHSLHRGSCFQSLNYFIPFHACLVFR